MSKLGKIFVVVLILVVIVLVARPAFSADQTQVKRNPTWGTARDCFILGPKRVCRSVKNTPVAIHSGPIDTGFWSETNLNYPIIVETSGLNVVINDRNQDGPTKIGANELIFFFWSVYDQKYVSSFDDQRNWHSQIVIVEPTNVAELPEVNYLRIHFDGEKSVVRGLWVYPNNREYNLADETFENYQSSAGKSPMTHALLFLRPNDLNHFAVQLTLEYEWLINQE